MKIMAVRRKDIPEAGHDFTPAPIDEAGRERLRKAPGVIFHKRPRDWSGWSFTPLPAFDKPVDVLWLLGRRDNPFEDSNN
jgi:hypothetical protein